MEVSHVPIIDKDINGTICINGSDSSDNIELEQKSEDIATIKSCISILTETEEVKDVDNKNEGVIECIVNNDVAVTDATTVEEAIPVDKIVDSEINTVINNSDDAATVAPASDAATANDAATASDAATTTPILEGLPELKYDKDQWSPDNPTGKRVYSRDFLLLLSKSQGAQKKPEKTGQIDLVIADESKLQNRPAPRPRTADNDLSSFAGKSTFVPAFVKPSPRSGSQPNRRSQHGKQTSRNEGRRDDGDGRDNRDGRDGGGRDRRDGRDGGGRNRGGKPNIIEINLSLRTDVKLNECENAWKPTHAKREPKNDTDTAILDDLYKKFRSILNKLTPQNFKKLIAQVRDLKIDNDEKLSGVINLVFEKAVDEPNFSEIYALMCKELEQITVKKSNNNGDETISFKFSIIRRCQTEFEKASVEERISTKKREEIQECTDPEKKKLLVLAFNEQERKERVRSVGNVRFIGELFKQKYISGNIMIVCIKTLIKKIEEETMECLCKLLTTIGKELELDHKVDLLPYFNEMRKIGEDKTNPLNSRIRFMIKDVIELRLNAWIPRQKLAAPKKLDDYQLDLEADRYNKNSYSKHSNSMSTSHRGDQSYSGRNAGSRSVTEDSGWSSVSSRNRTKQPYVDPAKLKNMNSSVSDVSLTPPTSGMWGRGSASGKKDVQPAKAPIMPSTRKTSTITFNPYSALLDEEALQSAKKKDIVISLDKTIPKSESAPAQVQSESANEPEGKGKITVERMLEDFIRGSEDPYSELLENLQCSVTSEGLPIAVKTIIKRSVSFKKTKQIQVIGKVLGTLVVKKLISCDVLLGVLKSALEETPELFVNDDFYDKFSRFVWAFSTQTELTFAQIHTACTPILNAGKGFELLMAIFLEKVEDSNESHLVKRLWEASGKLTVSDWMSPDNAEEFVKYWITLDFLSSPVQVKQFAPESACDEFLDLMRERKTVDEFKKWVEVHIGDKINQGWFIRGLTEAVYTYAMCSPEFHAPRFEVDKLKIYYPLLVHYIANKLPFEMECLFAIQNLLTELEHPQGIAGQLFEHLWDNGEAVSNDAFLKWEADNTQLKGKGVLLKELTSFFTILKSTEDSSDEASQVDDDQ